MKSKNINKFAKIKFTPHSIEVEQLRSDVGENFDYFITQKSPESSQLANVLNKLSVNLDKVSKIKNDLESAARDCDYDENSPGNGYWSFIHNFNCAIKSVQKICKQMTKNREKMLFNKKFYAKELDLWTQIFESLIEICEELLQIRARGDKKCLYSNDNNWVILNRLTMSIHQKAFYGTALGFQCVKSMKPIVNLLVTSLASYSKYHYSDKHKSIRFLDFPVTTGKYFLKPQRRAHKFIATSHKGDVDFCKSYWFLSESPAMHTLPNALSVRLDVNKIFKIPAEPFKLFSPKYQELIDIPLPHSHTGIKAVSCRLLSSQRRDGMMKKKSSMPKSRYLCFHVHGGGWAAQTSKSHEIYLKQWATHLDCPILSIDYSLAPKNPFPRGLEDCYFAYCWALNNLDYLGTTGEKIVFAGDSAGANLNSALMVKCIENGVRIPNGILNIYGIYTVDFMISPSGSLTLIDPMLPFGLTSNLLKSYGMDAKASKELQNTDSNGNFIDAIGLPHDKHNFVFKKSHLLSPYRASDEILKQFPKTIFLSTILDPLLDDSIEFGRKLRDLNVNVHVDVLSGLYHGFLYFIKISKECRDASMLCAVRIKQLLEE